MTPAGGMIAFAALLCPLHFARAAATAPAFEVASIKRHVVAGDRRGADAPQDAVDPAMVSLRAASPGELLQFAFDCKSSQQIVGVPPRLDREYYDALAKTASPASTDQQRLMMRSLLADRFRLACHLETRSVPGYALVAGRRLHMRPAGRETADFSPTPVHSRRGGEMIFTYSGKISMPQLADWLWRRFTRPVVDRTGLSGVFRFTVAVTPDQAMGFDDFTAAIRDQLGVEIKAQRVSIEVVVVDHMERPSEN